MNVWLASALIEYSAPITEACIQTLAESRDMSSRDALVEDRENFGQVSS